MSRIDCQDCGRQFEPNHRNECEVCGELYCESCVDSHGCSLPHDDDRFPDDEDRYDLDDFDFGDDDP